MKDQDLFVLNKLLPLLYYIAQAGFEFPSAWIIGMDHTHHYQLEIYLVECINPKLTISKVIEGIN